MYMPENQENQNKKTYDEKRQERFREEQLREKKHLVKKYLKRIVIALAILLPLSLGGWYVATLPETPDSEVLSRDGLHWHSQLLISIKGEQQTIPTDIGLGGAVHNPIHTHDTNGEIHLEMSGLVKKSDTTLGNFFRIWKKQFNNACIFDSCNGSQGTVKMYVNGNENTEFEKYQMKDKDKIEIKFE